MHVLDVIPGENAGRIVNQLPNWIDSIWCASPTRMRSLNDASPTTCLSVRRARSPSSGRNRHQTDHVTGRNFSNFNRQRGLLKPPRERGPVPARSWAEHEAPNGDRGPTPNPC